jgi:hypothetical protein
MTIVVHDKKTAVIKNNLQPHSFIIILNPLPFALLPPDIPGERETLKQNYLSNQNNFFFYETINRNYMPRFCSSKLQQ